ncbi:MAG: SLC13 family permease [Candidatus Baltobacteraceae bacterium]
MLWSDSAVWAVAAVAIAGMLLRPWRVPEWIWASGGATLLVGTRLLDPAAAFGALGRGVDVYAFLIGIMGLSEIARSERVFAWIAHAMLSRGGGSQRRLFGLVYGIGVLVTIFLSNDTTAVVLTPAVIAALAQTDVDPLPYLFACAFVANAASFVLPISNPANLVVFGRHLPLLGTWLSAFGIAAAASVGLTYLTLRFCTRRLLRGPYSYRVGLVTVSARTRFAAALIAAASLLLVVAATFGWNLGLTALCSAGSVLLVIGLRDIDAVGQVARHISWQVVPLVAGLFVIVAALDSRGATESVRLLITTAGTLGHAEGRLLVAGAFALADNVFNNLPVAVAGGYALSSMHLSSAIAHATLVAVDIGPNLSVSGSLATILWLIALRREGIHVTARQFLGLWAAVGIPALIAACLLVR